jgi:hypothetical protein
MLSGLIRKTKLEQLCHRHRKKTNLSAQIPTKMGEEDNDVPDNPSPYGIAGWEQGDKSVLINDRFDIWKVNPATGAAINLTNNVGRKNKLIFRYRATDPDEKAIPSDKALWLITQNDNTKQWGYYKKAFGGGAAPEKVVMAPYAYSSLQKAKDVDAYIYTKPITSTRQTFIYHQILKQKPG